MTYQLHPSVRLSHFSLFSKSLNSCFVFSELNHFTRIPTCFNSLRLTTAVCSEMRAGSEYSITTELICRYRDARLSVINITRPVLFVTSDMERRRQKHDAFAIAGVYRLKYFIQTFHVENLTSIGRKFVVLSNLILRRIVHIMLLYMIVLFWSTLYINVCFHFSLLKLLKLLVAFTAHFNPGFHQRWNLRQ